eukprot:CAMPEP_0202485282 /NCGR_PEP_ID=MMETSP1361-20130828/4158_1 /ASSEMBLY_ACC=CAM_ASM_000849 /TAXON_ID=210615 /ORGANISM="Staurosira complex sp., Strain CCMP2646" /LENGTH=45 /DNA_ID= /DNA_START= /DNA_END= /DNA_ORIENTATION=
MATVPPVDLQFAIFEVKVITLVRAKHDVHLDFPLVTIACRVRASK